MNKSKAHAFSFIMNLCLVILSTISTITVLEMSARVYRGKIFSTDPIRPLLSNETAGPRAIYHSLLGYQPKPGKYVSHFTATVDLQGLRKHGCGIISDSKILAVGDSYTFGDDVGDEETWPAHLACKLNKRVYNGGVFGYGVDQTILRAELLIDEYIPDILIISMIADDLKRSEMSYRYAWKPYFEIQSDQLILRNVPVPNLPPPVRFKRLRDLLYYSHFADAVIRRVFPEWWYVEGAEQKVHELGTEVASRLMYRLADKVNKYGIRTIVVAQTDRSMDDQSLLPVLYHANLAGFETIDLAAVLVSLIRKNPELEERFFIGQFGGHMSSEGNEWVAAQLQAHLEKERVKQRVRAQNAE